jgi:hypothetical protein
MNRPDDELAGKIVGHLDYGAERLDPAVRERLATARQAALARYRSQPEPAFGLAWAMATISGRGGHSQGARYVVALATLLVALSGVVYWQTRAPSDFTDIDVNLLTDDLPINAYLDQGFDSWLKRPSR